MLGGFDFAVLWANASFLWNGMLLTMQLTALAVTGGLLFGVILAVLRLSRIRLLAWLVEGYVNFLRSMPLILVIFWFYTLVPKLIGRPVSGFYSVLIAFVMFEAAYYSEIVRAGISSVRRGQIAAAMALGLTNLQAMRYVILPQAVRNMVPVLLTQSIVMLQDTSLVYVVGLRDFSPRPTLSPAAIIDRPSFTYLSPSSSWLSASAPRGSSIGLRRKYAL
jgi:glutamate/aspartate transport system permease protein